MHAEGLLPSTTPTPIALTSAIYARSPAAYDTPKANRYGDVNRVVISSIVSAPAIYGDPGTGVSDAPEPSTNPDTVPLL